MIIIRGEGTQQWLRVSSRPVALIIIFELPNVGRASLFPSGLPFAPTSSSFGLFVMVASTRDERSLFEPITIAPSKGSTEASTG
jgi:hypothetical protein